MALGVIGLFITAILAPFLGVLMVSKVGKQFTDLGLLLHPTPCEAANAAHHIMYRSAGSLATHGSDYF